MDSAFVMKEHIATNVSIEICKIKKLILIDFKKLREVFELFFANCTKIIIIR